MSTTMDIANRYVGASASGAAYDVKSPATGDVVASVPNAGEAEARQAADTASRAFETWRRTTAFERSAILERWCDLLMDNQEELATAMTTEMGKPIKESCGEVAYAAGFVKWYAEEAKRIAGETVQSQFEHKRLFAIKQPVGPVYAVTPWNFPLAMVTRKAAPALAAGCTFVLKPAEQSPLSALMAVDLWREAGGPEGTLQVITTQDPVPVTAAMMEDPRIAKITFSGSTEGGPTLYRQAADTVKRISLELGGHAPLNVFDDADLDVAVEQAVACKYRNAGQTCVCTNRIYVQAGIAEEFTKAFSRASEALKVGNPLLDETDIGPLVDQQGLTKVKAHMQDALAKGARVVTGGEALDGLYFQPTVVQGVSEDMLMMQEETFGPVAPVISFGDEADAVRMANDSPYGLAAYLFTNDISRAWRVTEALDYGIVGVNDGVPSTPQAPFGGVKQSGIGREGGHWGLEEYLEVKYVSMGLREGG